MSEIKIAELCVEYERGASEEYVLRKAKEILREERDKVIEEEMDSWREEVKDRALAKIQRLERGGNSLSGEIVRRPCTIGPTHLIGNNGISEWKTLPGESLLYRPAGSSKVIRVCSCPYQEGRGGLDAELAIERIVSHELRSTVLETVSQTISRGLPDALNEGADIEGGEVREKRNAA